MTYLPIFSKGHHEPSSVSPGVMLPVQALGDKVRDVDGEDEHVEEDVGGVCSAGPHQELHLERHHDTQTSLHTDKHGGQQGDVDEHVPDLAWRNPWGYRV